MKRKTLIIGLFIISLIFFGCATNKHIRNAETFMSRNNYERAARECRYALNRSPNNQKAYVGLQDASNAFVKVKLQEFDQYYNRKDYKRADATMKSINSFVDRNSRYRIKANIPHGYSNKHNYAIEQIAEDYYSKGRRALSQGNFNSAINFFKEVLEYKSSYKDTRTLLRQAEDGQRTATAERHYQSGLRSYEQGNYRQAYRSFSSCLNTMRNYRDAQSLRASALEKGRVKIGIFEFRNDTRIFGAEGALYSHVVTNAVNHKSPFIQVVDRTNLNRLLSEHRFTMDGIVDVSTASRAGNLLGLDYVVIGRLVNVSTSGGHITSQNVQAYELYHIQRDGKNVPQGRPVNFTLYEGSTTATFEAQYQVISVETGQIIKSNIVSASENDAVRYAKYRGDHTKLYATDPGVAKQGSSGLANLATALLVSATKIDNTLFTANQHLKSPENMQTPIIRNLGRRISNEICKEFE